MRIKLSVIGLVLTVAFVPVADARTARTKGDDKVAPRIGVKDRLEKPTQTVQGAGSGGAKARTIPQGQPSNKNSGNRGRR